MAEASPRPGRERGDRVGAVAARGRRKRGLGWLRLLIAALILAALAFLLWALLHRGNSTPVVATTAATSATPSGPNNTPSTTATPSTPSTPSTAVTGAPGVPGQALIGGGSLTARPGTGAGAPAGTLGTLLFAEGSARLDPNSRRVLASTAQQIKASGPAAVTVTGYTDKVGADPRNAALSRRRADTVAAALRQELGSMRTVVTTAAGGSGNPIASDSTVQGRQLNRRVSVTTGAAPTASVTASGTPATASPASAPLVGGGTVTAVPATGAAAAPGQVGTVLFGSGTAALDAQGQLVLAAAAQRIRTARPTAVTVTGYTDTVGGQPTNGPLAAQRAQTVAGALRARLGAAAPRITIAARGQADPVAPNATSAGRQLNRRVTITAG